MSVRSSRSEKRSRTFDRSILGDRSAQAGRIAEYSSAKRMRRDQAMSITDEIKGIQYETSPPAENYQNMTNVQQLEHVRQSKKKAAYSKLIVSRFQNDQRRSSSAQSHRSNRSSRSQRSQDGGIAGLRHNQNSRRKNYN